jgi:tetratricopeptide (TPR) repeat protein
LPKQQRRLVQACAVIGIDVPLRLAAKLMDISEQDLHPRLVKLQSEQLLYETRKYPELQFSFKHALTRDVAYNTILPSKRREYHTKVIEILESDATQSTDAYLDDLCMHSVHAQVWPKAVTYLRVAASLAVERSSYELAEVYLNRALDIAERLPEDADMMRSKIEILLGLRSLVGRNSKHQEARRLLDLAEGLAASLGDPELQLRIMVMRIYVLNILGDLDAAVVLAKRSQQLGQALGHVRMFALATYYLGQANFNLGNLAAAEEALSNNLELLSKTAFVGPTGTLGTLPVLTHVTRAMVRAFAGEFANASRDAELARDYARQSGRPYDLSFASFGDGFVRVQQRQGDAAAQAFRESLSLGESREMVDPGSLPPLLRAAGADELRQFEASRASLPHCQIGLGHALLLNGDLGEAGVWLSQAYEIVRKANRHMMHVWASACLAHLHFATGHSNAAARYADEAVEVAQKFAFNGFGAAALRIRGLVRAGERRAANAASDDLNAALVLASMLGMRVEIAHCHAALALSSIGETGVHLDAARNAYEELGMTQWFEHLMSKSKSSHVVWC